MNTAENLHGETTVITKGGLNTETKFLLGLGLVFACIVFIVVAGIVIKRILNKKKREKYLRRPYDEN